ncbi:hypothetical protein [Natribacillus halophilus]|uniref:Uncharacterized protein n=1 Tax=Natribacillus halophilus TaxID=549003 RepID=A0A1G8SWU2_9BACI|nr:hypothetical protein [Natribacillus halophilus]SDJ33661.1 hypothetical protein SAMN04488123_1387 [Natribacillus halophilus]
MSETSQTNNMPVFFPIIIGLVGIGVIISYSINFSESDGAAFFIILGVVITISSIYRIYRMLNK